MFDKYKSLGAKKVLTCSSFTRWW